jgi:hypothetical protein
MDRSSYDLGVYFPIIRQVTNYKCQKYTQSFNKEQIITEEEKEFSTKVV